MFEVAKDAKGRVSLKTIATPLKDHKDAYHTQCTLKSAGAQRSGAAAATGRAGRDRPALFLTQALNGLQLGVLLFLLAAGLTLVFGIMNFVNLAHGSLYMMGAYFAAAVFERDRLVRARGVVAMPGDDAARHRRRARRAHPPVPPRPPRPGAGDVRPDPVLQRARAHHLGAGVACT